MVAVPERGASSSRGDTGIRVRVLEEMFSYKQRWMSKRARERSVWDRRVVEGYGNRLMKVDVVGKRSSEKRERDLRLARERTRARRKAIKDIERGVLSRVVKHDVCINTLGSGPGRKRKGLEEIVNEEIRKRVKE
jgi:hypothetical protein